MPKDQAGSFNCGQVHGRFNAANGLVRTVAALPLRLPEGLGPNSAHLGTPLFPRPRGFLLFAYVWRRLLGNAGANCALLSGFCTKDGQPQAGLLQSSIIVRNTVSRSLYVKPKESL